MAMVARIWGQDVGREGRPDKEVVSTGDVARYLGVSVRTVQRMVQRGVLVPTFLTPGGQPRFRLTEVAAALAIQGDATLSVDSERPCRPLPDQARRFPQEPGALATELSSDLPLAELVRVDQLSNPLPVYTYRANARTGEWVLATMNDAANRHMRHRTRTVLGAAARQIHAAEPDILAQIERCAQEKRTMRPVAARTDVVAGERRVFQDTYAFVPPNLVLRYVEDITAHTQAEADVAAQDHLFRVLTEDISALVCTVDTDGMIGYASPSSRTLLGREPDELIGTSALAHVHPDDLAQAQTAFVAHEGGMGKTPLLRMRHTNGSWRWMELVVTDARHDPLLSGFVVTGRDVTDRIAAEQRLHAQYMGNPIPAYTWQVIGDDWELVSFNDAALVMTHGTASQLLGRRARDLYQDRPHILADYEQCTGNHTTIQREAAGPISSNGEIRELIVTYVFVPPDLVMVYLEDVTERKQAEARLMQAAQEKNLLVAALNVATSGILLTDATQPDLPITYVNPAFEAITGYRAAEVLGRNCRFLQGPETNPRTKEQIRAALQEGQPFVGIIRNYRADGTPFWNELRITPLHDMTGRLTHFVGLQNDVSERVSLEEALHHQALHDALTDLPNRRLLADRLDQALARAQRMRHPVALLLLDLDRFKEVNDTLGHPQGDRLLRAVAICLTRLLRASDTIARLGGDEFAIVLPDTDAEAAMAIAAKIGTLIEESLTDVLAEVQEAEAGTGSEAGLGGMERPGHVSASIGIAVSPDHGSDGPTLLRHADVAMYAAKRYQTRLTLYQPAEDPYTPDRLTLLADLRTAIMQGALVLYYQPKVALASGMVVGVEALVRWPHPQRGLVRPDQFIVLAEQTGLIWSLTDWVLGEALRQWRRWNEAGREIQIAINLSALNVQDRTLPDRISQALKTYGVPATALRLEVTETALMADQQRARDVLARLMELGVGLSIDDYGTGHSALAYLKHLPVDELKIDRSFVGEMLDHPADAAIVASTIALGHNLGLWVVAEGVETAEQQRALRDMGCDVGQGFQFSRPLPPDRFDVWLKTQPQQTSVGQVAVSSGDNEGSVPTY